MLASFMSKVKTIAFDSMILFGKSDQCGEVTEWLKVHAWKACVQQCTGGSNPPLSASSCGFGKRRDAFYKIIIVFCSVLIDIDSIFRFNVCKIS